MWRLFQYRGVVTAVLESNPEDLDSVERRLDLLEERGNLCREPISKNLGDGIFELRGQRGTRIFFYFRPNREIVFVHSVVKRQRKVDRADIEIATKIRREIEGAGADVTNFAR